MANNKKISELDFVQSVSGDDEFLVVDKSTNVGDDASATGKTSKVTLNQIKDGLFPAGSPIQFWNANSNDIFFNTGKVGIGTDSPDTQLQIQNNGGTNSYGLQILGSNTEKNRIAGIFDTHIASTDRSAGALTLHNSDTTTEVFISSYPGADSYINNGGNVGIGTTNPFADLEFSCGLHIAGQTPRLRLQDDNPTSDGVWDVMNNNSVFTIQHRNAEGTAVSNYFHIKDNGNVGIGTNNPTSTLHISGAGTGDGPTHQNGNRVGWITLDGYGYLKDADGNDTTTQESWMIQPGTNNLAIKTWNNKSVVDFNMDEDGEAVSTEFAGNVGIGTSNPSQELVISGLGRVKATSEEGKAWSFYSTENATNNKAWQFGQLIGEDARYEDQFFILPSYNDAEGNTQTSLSNGLYINTSGNVGIGTADPINPLHSTSEDATHIGMTRKIDITNSTNGAATKIAGGALVTDGAGGLVPSHGAAIGFVLRDHSGTSNGATTKGYMYFDTKDLGGSLTEKMRITNDGCVGIGETNPSGHSLVIDSKQNACIFAKVTGTGNYKKYFLRGFQGDTQLVQIGADEANNGEIIIRNKDGVVTSSILNGNILTEGSITTHDFQVNGDFAYSGTMYNIGTDVSDIDNVHETNMRGIETLNKIHVCDYTINGKTIVGCVSQDIKNALPSAVSEIKKEVEVCPSKGNIIHGDGDSKLIVRANVTKNDFEKQSWPESYQFVQTHDAETEDVTKLAVSQDQLIATLIKSVQELNEKVNHLSAEVRKNK